MACTASASASSPRGYGDVDMLAPVIRGEFEALKISSSAACPITQQADDEVKFAAAVHSSNTHKNRYYNILADEETRVKLAPLEQGDEDYINANYIDGEVPNSKRAYILTQAPLPHTFADFWRMVWQEKSTVIACLTMLREAQKVKAHKYWPEDGQLQQYGKIFVAHNLSVLFKNHTIVRSFTIWKEGDSASPMEVLQLHYQDWPDFGAPASTEAIRIMANLVSALKERGRQRNGVVGPAIVHCSAGVGRAGTFVATHITMTKIEHLQATSRDFAPRSLFDYPITIKDTVAKLRSQRTGIVQTLDQYTFIYRAIADTLLQESRRAISKRTDPDGVLSSTRGNDEVNSKDRVGVSAFLDILSGRPSKCMDNNSSQGLSSSSEQIA